MHPMQRESPYPMVAIEQARQIIQQHTPSPAAEEVAALAADGRILAEDVVAAAPVPDMPKSAVDGYALRAADGLAPRRVLAEITAGGTQGASIGPGEAARIMTGAPLPAGADAVVMVEQTSEEGGVVSIQHAPQPGQSVHPVGQDIAQAALVLPRGAAIGPAEVGLLATLGRTRVLAYRRPRVAVLATGDEVYEPDTAPPPGGIRDSNRYTLMAAVRAAGAEPISLGIARDDRATQRAAILAGLAQADVLLTSGGVSMGTHDLIKPLLAELGTVHFGRVAFKPGKPTMFATVGGQPVFGLPGYPVSSLVSFEVFVRPMLRRMQGDPVPGRPHVSVLLAEHIQASPDRPEYQRAVVSFEQGRLVARSTGGQGSSRLLSMRGANALLVVPPRDGGYAPGQQLLALLTGPLA
ncbi:molybdopterin molybdotransferase MoeA [Chloroflexia bacterium SDU3-3]|nr:molybdopterin molybdotransferase MoeA [Chloroflexia bacterium SDU3-3]